MASGDIARVRRAPGRMVVNPTTAFDGGSFPYGGTEIGKVNGVMLQPLGASFRVECEALGEATDILESDNRWVFAFFLRGWDDDGIELLFADGYEAGSVSQHSSYFVPGTKSPGESALDRAVKLAFVPDDPIHVPGVLVYRGVPDWTESAEVAFQRGNELGLPVAVECMRDGNDNILRVGRLNDLSLT